MTIPLKPGPVPAPPPVGLPAQGQGQSQSRKPTNLIVNVQFGRRDLGEIGIAIAPDGSVSLPAAPFRELVRPLLNDAGLARLDTTLAGRTAVSPDDVRPSGIDLAFSQADVALAIASIDPAMRRAQDLFRPTNLEAENKINASPEPFSFLLDASLSQTYAWNGPDAGLRHPGIYFTSAARMLGLVIEGAGQFADRRPGQPQPDFAFDRNFVRLVYDKPDWYLRALAGDLTPEVRLQQNYVQMGGVGISRQRRRFDSFRSAVLQGNRQLLLQRESTVEVYRNGGLFQQIKLGPGAYDLNNLPLLAGSNDIRINVRDESGIAQSLNLQTYLDPIDLAPGDWEGGAYVGRMARRFGLSPVYDGELAFSGFVRKSFRNHPAVGLTLQGSRSVQQAGLQSQILLGPGRLDMSAAASRSRVGNGWFAGLLYDLAIDNGDRGMSLNLQATAQSRLFTGLGAPDQVNSTFVTTSATLTRIFSQKFSGQVGAFYVRNRRPAGDSYRLFADGFYQLSRKWFARFGVDYQDNGLRSRDTRNRGLGFQVGLVWRPSDSNRAEGRYDSRFREAQLNFEHAPNGYVGSIGYGGVVAHSPTRSGVQGYASYIGNRFAASASHSATGPGFGNLNDRQVSTARISTALAYAGGAFSVTRNIGDSFAIVTPHPSLGSSRVIIGQLLTDSHYRSRSGALGGAVQGNLGSYITQSVQYDVEDAPVGYDTGLGLFRVRPPYRSGYHLVVGSDSFVTAMGTVADTAGKPAAYLSGTLIDLDNPSSEPVPFFTNSIGRFAAVSLRPGGKYEIRLSSGEKLRFAVPADNKGLYDMKTITIDREQ
ncbi:hypothetical protein [Sphingomonas astaxanthinifaciens]|uniref:hypothetical protein n=1 Tax=Sphingomonas astaxanthinifaciens TaxID=407019 RepID=UPI00146FA97A|nr:hypothetical protein [Sphingomonas astaxanthinifaciens]